MQVYVMYVHVLSSKNCTIHALLRIIEFVAIMPDDHSVPHLTMRESGTQLLMRALLMVKFVAVALTVNILCGKGANCMHNILC